MQDIGQEYRPVKMGFNNTKAQLEETQDELEKTKTELADTQAELNRTKTELEKVKAELEKTKTTVFNNTSKGANVTNQAKPIGTEQTPANNDSGQTETRLIGIILGTVLGFVAFFGICIFAVRAKLHNKIPFFKNDSMASTANAESNGGLAGQCVFQTAAV